jgi:transposase
VDIKVIGVDIAKRYFQFHAIDGTGVIVMRRKVTRDLFLKLLTDIPRCIVGIEAGSGARHWARELGKLGHDVRLMPPSSSALT